MSRVRELARCSGQCCESFYLPVSPDELRQALELWVRMGELGMDARAWEERDRHPEVHLWADIELIATMAVPLGFFEQNPVHPDGSSVEGGGWFYTCRHYDQGTRQCTIYETRPSMCRDYPYGRECKYTACTYRYEFVPHVIELEGDVVKLAAVLGVG